MADQEYPQKTGLMIAALALAAVAVIGVLGWMTGSLPNRQAPPMDIALEPLPTPDIFLPIANGDEEPLPAAATETEMGVPAPSPEIAGVAATANTGPAEAALAAVALLTLVGFAGSLMVAKLA